MRILVPWLLAFLLMASASFGAERDLSEFPPDIRKIYEKNKLTVAMYHNDVMPMFFTDKKGDLIGFDVELARSIAAALGVPVEFNRTPETFNAVVDAAANHEADLGISLVTATLDRALKVSFSDPYLVLHPTLTINRLTAARYSFPKADVLRDIRQTNQKIGVQAGTSYENFARDIFPKAEIAKYLTWDKAMEAAYRGEVLAVLRDEVGVKNFIYQRPEMAVNLQIITLKSPKDPIGIVVPSDSPQLLDWVNAFLKLNYPRTSVDDIYETYREYYPGLQ